MKEFVDKLNGFEEGELQMEKVFKQLDQMKSMLFVDQLNLLFNKGCVPTVEDKSNMNVRTWLLLLLLFSSLNEAISEYATLSLTWNFQVDHVLYDSLQYSFNPIFHISRKLMTLELLLLFFKTHHLGNTIQNGPLFHTN